MRVGKGHEPETWPRPARQLSLPELSHISRRRLYWPEATEVSVFGQTTRSSKLCSEITPHRRRFIVIVTDSHDDGGGAAAL
jgi:hypothetical protein